MVVRAARRRRKASSTAHPTTAPTQVCPFATRRGRKPHELRQTRPTQPVGIHYKNNSYQRFTSRRRKRFSPKKSIPYLQPTPVLHQTRLLQSLHHHLRRRRQQPVRPRNDS